MKPIVPRAKSLPRHLRVRIEKHRTWVASGGARGKRLRYDGPPAINLARQSLVRIEARRASFGMCNLDGADLSGADLTEADFGLASCRGTNFEGANMHRATLTGADLEGANLSGTVLDECLAFGTNFKDAVFAGTSLRGSTLDPLRVKRGMPGYIATLHGNLLRVSQCVCDRMTLLPRGLRRTFARRQRR